MGFLHAAFVFVRHNHTYVYTVTAIFHLSLSFLFSLHNTNQAFSVPRLQMLHKVVQSESFLRNPGWDAL